MNKRNPMPTKANGAIDPGCFLDDLAGVIERIEHGKVYVNILDQERTPEEFRDIDAFQALGPVPEGLVEGQIVKLVAQQMPIGNALKEKLFEDRIYYGDSSIRRVYGFKIREV